MATNDPPKAVNLLLAKYVGDLSDLDVERLLGIPRGTVYNWTKTGTSPNIIGLYRFRRQFDIPWGEIEEALSIDAAREDEDALHRRMEQLTETLLETVPEGEEEMRREVEQLREMLRRATDRGDRSGPGRSE